MTFMTVEFVDNDYLKLTKTARENGLRPASFARIVLNHVVKDREYIATIPIPEGLSHRQTYKRKKQP